jgi:hypothetical protein
MRRATLIYPAHLVKPEDFVGFVHSTIFDRVWRKIGLTDTDDLLALQLIIMSDPKGSPMIEGTGGARKLRFVPPDWPGGKSGALRVIYAYFESFHKVALLLPYPKQTKETLTNEEKKVIKQEVRSIREGLRK